MKIYKNGILWFEVTSPDELIALSQTIANNLRNNYFTNVQTMNLIATARSLYQVAEMPETPTINTIYYVGSTSPYNVKLVDSNGTIVDLGSSTVDLSNFYTKAESDNRYLNRQDFLNTMYPKGSIYITYENKNPSTFLGGTWVLIGGQDANLNYYPAFAISTDEEGTTINESLPNIIGYYKQVCCDISANVDVSYKSLYSSAPTRQRDWGGTSGSGLRQLNIDASRSSNIYQNGAHVNVNAIKLFFWRRIDENNIGITLNPITISTNIDSSSTNTEMAGAKAVYDFVINTLYPIGKKYVQYPWDEDPNTRFVGTIWVEDNSYNGKYFIVDSSQTVGTAINESLPNITGVCNTTIVDSSSRSGAITKTNFLQNSLKYQSGSTGMDKCDLTFNASGSSPVYQDNAHVNVNAIKLFFWRRIDENNIGITLNPITISTNIDSSSTNTEMAGAKAVYDAVSSISEPKVITKTYNSTYIRESYGRFIAIGKILIAEIGLYVKTKIPANTVFCEITSDITVGTGEWYGFLISDSSTFTEQKTRVILSSSSKKIKVKGIPIPEGWWFGNLTILLE